MQKVKEGYKMTELGEIPVDWEVKNLIEVSQGKGEYGIGAVATEYVQGKPRYLRITDIGDESKLLFNDIKGLDDDEYEKYIMKQNDIVFARTGNTTGKSYVYDVKYGKLVYAGFLIKYSINPKFANVNFIKYVVQSKRYWDWVNVMSTRSGQPGINSNEYAKFLIQIPNIKEQQKISLILSFVDEQIKINDNLIEKTKELKKGLMQKLLTKGIGHSRFKYTEIGSIPEEWEVIKLSECGEVFGGNAFKSKYFLSDFYDNTYQVIRMGNVQQGKLQLGRNPVYLDKKYVAKKDEKYVLKVSDILISLTGTVNKTDYGNISWVSKNNRYLLNQRVACIRNKENDFINRFYFYFLQGKTFRNQFFQLGVGGTGNQANVSISDLNEILVYKPSIEEQQEIAKILSSVDEQIDQYEAKKEKLQELKKGLMQKLLTGKIRVQ